MIRPAVGIFSVALCAAFAVGASFAQVPAPAPAVPASPVPHVKFDATEAALGEVVRGQDAVATFTYHNTGNAPLHILGAKPG